MARLRHHLATFAILTCLAGGPAFACAASKQLEGFAETYATLLNATTRADWRTISDTLAHAIKTTDAVALGRDLGVEGAPADISRISRLLSDASALATGNWEDREGERERAILNLTYVDRLLRATGCNFAPVSNALITLKTKTGDTSDGFLDPTILAHSEGAFSLKAIVIKWPITLTILSLLATAGIAALFYARAVRVVLAERLPRHRAAISVMVAAKDHPTAVVETIDISRRGARLVWISPPPPGTPLHIDFADLSVPSDVIWSNANFAGVMFTTKLSVDDLKTILERTQTAAL